MKNTILFLAAMLVLFTGCNKYDDDISRIDKILEQLTHGSITSIEQQVQNISASVSDLQKVDAELKDLIASLESGGNEQATFLAELKAKDAELEKTIVALQAYVDGGMDDMEGWANATFATLEQYADVQMWIEALKVAISNQNKWNDETDQLIGMLVEDLLAAIKASETSMKAWVNGVLADGYYDIAAIDAQLNALETQLTTADADLKKQIADQKAALEKAKTDLTAAYKKAIDDAITTNNGIINKAIADAVQDALDKVDAKLAAIDNVIAAIQKDIEAIKSSINSIDQQIAAINSSIKNLKEVDAELDGYIKSLQTTATDLQTQLDATNEKIDNVKKEMGEEIDAVEQNLLNELNKLKTYIEGELATINNAIAALQEKDAELDQKIADLRTYVDNELANYATKDWANATFATLTQYLEIQNAIADIESGIKSINEELTDLEISLNEKIAADINAAINALEIKMRGWVNEQLQQPLKDIADLQAALNALTGEVATDEELAAAVAEQEKALEQAKKDLTAAYEAAIKKAIDDNNGVIDTAIAAAITTATNNLNTEINNIKSEITAIKSRLDELEKNFANRIQSLTFVPQYSDGKILMDYSIRGTRAHFRISPAEIAEVITTDNVKAFARYTDDPTTRASYKPEFPLTIRSVSGDNTGMLEVNITESSENQLSTDFWQGKVEAIIYIQITDENGNNVVSDAIPMIAHNYAGNTNTIGGYGDGGSQFGEAGQ